jgi:predicted dehydrogenase
VSAMLSTRVPQWFETDTKKYVDVTSPDNIMIQGRLESGAVLNAYVGVHPYHGSGHRFEIYGKEGTLMMIGGGEAGQETSRKIMGGKKDDKALQELPVPDRLKWVPQAVRDVGRSYDVGQMWVNFAKAIRTGSNIEPDFDHAVRRHRMLDAVVRASETGQRQKVQL